jgi:hypothetical protein
MALPAHALREGQGRLKSKSNGGHFTIEDEKLFRPYLPSHCSGVTEICHLELPALALRAVNLMLKSVSNVGHFTLETLRVFSPYLVSHWTGITKICHMALTAHALPTAQLRLKSVSNEGHFTLESKTFSSVSPLPWQWGHCKMPYGTPCTCATTTPSYVDVGR